MMPVVPPHVAATWYTGTILFRLHRRRGYDYALAGVAILVAANAIKQHRNRGG